MVKLPEKSLIRFRFQARLLPDKLKLWVNRVSLPFLLLLLALSIVFLFGNDRGLFYRPGLHDWNSSQTLAFAENFSFKHNFLIFHNHTLDAEGNLTYDYLYNRFPLGGYALIKLAILPFGDDLSAKIFAARMLMLLLFSAGAVLAYQSISRIIASPWIASAATLLAFSSYYCLYYSDKISNEVSPDLFAVMLVFHGMVIFVQDGRFRQLLIKTIIALLLGWHVLALLLPFIALGLASELIKARSADSDSTPPPRVWLLWQLPRILPYLSLLRSRYLMLGVAALLITWSVLSFNFANEYLALEGKESLTELPSFKSMLYRTGQDRDFNDRNAKALAWGPFLYDQFYRISGMVTPYVLPPGYTNELSGWRERWNPEWMRGVFTGIWVSGVVFGGLFFVRHKILLATLVLSGVCWALLMRHTTAFHDFESVFYIGIPLLFFVLVLLYVRKLSGDRLLPSLAVMAALFFAFSTFQMSRVGYGLSVDRGQSATAVEAARFQADIIADYAAIGEITPRKSIFVPFSAWNGDIIQLAGAPWAISYYLSDSIIIYGNYNARPFADFLILGDKVEGAALLTPDNRQVFLYDRAVYDEERD